MMMAKQNKGILGIGLAAASLLFIPLVLMQFTDEVAWGPGDFIVAWILLASAGVMYKLVANKMGNITYRAAVGIAVGSGLFLVWSNLAVGIIGNEGNPANLMYLGVLAVGLIGIGMARFQPRGMAHALFAAALAQTLVALVALIAGLHRQAGTSVTEMVNINGLFVVLFVVSGLLFRHAARGNDRQPKPY